MSEHLTHIAIYEDTCRLIHHSGRFSAVFKESLQNHPDAGLISSGSRGNHLMAIPIIEHVRKDWEEKSKPNRYEELLAAAIGWLSHRAMDLQVKPNYLKEDEIRNPRYSTYEQQIYFDAVTFQKVYGGGKYNSISPHVFLSKATLEYRMNSHPAYSYIHVQEIEPMFVFLIQQQLLSMRRFNKRMNFVNDWLSEYSNEYQKLSENLNVYIEAFINPDPLKMKRYVEETNFYNEKDPIIRLVRDIQHERSTKIDLEEALIEAEDQSHYAQGLSRSIRFNRSANEFFLENISKEVVYDQVEIFNKSHRK